MSDLISRQAAIDALDRAEALTRAFGYHNVIDTIRELPSAEQKGEWIGKPIGGFATVRCSQCKEVYRENTGRWNFCPNCGADMRGDKDDACIENIKTLC